MLHAVVRGELDASGDIVRLHVGGHAFDVDLLKVTIQGPRGTLEARVGVYPRSRHWVAVFDHADAMPCAKPG
jgi:hypothetical protein